jgi:hypothetical protein
MNFEDFLSMHCDRLEMQRWWTSCVSRDHFIIPSHNNEYLPTFKTFIGGNYTKGDMPLTINRYLLENLRTHQEDTSVPFKCDFAGKLFELIDSCTHRDDYEL